MDNKLYKLLKKINDDLSDFISNSLNGENKVLDKCLKKDENGNFVEDKQHWDKMLVRSKNLQGLLEKLYVRLMTVNEVSDFKIARRMLNDEIIVWNYEIFLDFEENCDVKDTRFICLRMFNRTYETAMWYIDKAEDQLNEENGLAQNQLAQLKTNLSDTQRALLFDLLVKDGFIPYDTDPAGFIWVFGGESDKYTSFEIKWLKNKQLLRELLIPLRHSDIIQADYERIAPIIFIDKKGNQISLAKAKHIESTDSDKIAEIHKKIATR